MNACLTLTTCSVGDGSSDLPFLDFVCSCSAAEFPAPCMPYQPSSPGIRASVCLCILERYVLVWVGWTIRQLIPRSCQSKYYKIASLLLLSSPSRPGESLPSSFSSTPVTWHNPLSWIGVVYIFYISLLVVWPSPTAGRRTDLPV